MKTEGARPRGHIVSTSVTGPDEIPGQGKTPPLDEREARPHRKRACRKPGITRPALKMSSSLV